MGQCTTAQWRLITEPLFVRSCFSETPSLSQCDESDVHCDAISIMYQYDELHQCVTTGDKRRHCLRAPDLRGVPASIALFFRRIKGWWRWTGCAEGSEVDRRRGSVRKKPVHIVAEKCENLSQKSETVVQKWVCRRKVRKSPNFAVVSPFLVTVSLFCDSLTFVRQSHFSVTVWTGLKATEPQEFAEFQLGEFLRLYSLSVQSRASYPPRCRLRIQFIVTII